ncbi:MAG: hypothetical protein ACXQS3_03820 [Candidatus Methanofastidiosia archaeon]
MLEDGTFNSKNNFNYLKSKDIEAGIRIHKNASTRARGSAY